MHPDLEHLIQLQDLDLAVDRARRRIAELPASQQALEARLAERAGIVASVKERMAASQIARREIEKELAAVQGRLSKYKGQLLELKTNKEYQAMQKEMSVAEHDVRAHEDKLLEHMEFAETSAAELKLAEAALKTEQADVTRAQRALDAERVELERELERVTTARAELDRAGAPRSADAVRARGARPQGDRGCRGARRALHPVPRPSETAEVQRSAPQRRPAPVRQLHADSLLRPSTADRRRGPAVS